MRLFQIVSIVPTCSLNISTHSWLVTFDRIVQWSLKTSSTLPRTSHSAQPLSPNLLIFSTSLRRQQLGKYKKARKWCFEANTELLAVVFELFLSSPWSNLLDWTSRTSATESMTKIQVKQMCSCL